MYGTITTTLIVVTFSLLAIYVLTEICRLCTIYIQTGEFPAPFITYGNKGKWGEWVLHVLLAFAMFFILAGLWPILIILLVIGLVRLARYIKVRREQ